MKKRQMSGNDVVIGTEEDRWYKDCKTEEDRDAVHISEAHW